MDRQTIFKQDPEYHRIHCEILQKKNYTKVIDTTEYTVYELRDRAPDNKPEPSTRLTPWA